LGHETGKENITAERRNHRGERHRDAVSGRSAHCKGDHQCRDEQPVAEHQFKRRQRIIHREAAEDTEGGNSEEESGEGEGAGGHNLDFRFGILDC